MNRTLKWPIRLVVTLGILYVGICFYMKWTQTSHLFKPVVMSESHQIALKENQQEVRLTTEDGASIHGIHSKVPNSRGGVLFLHGNGGNVEVLEHLHERFNRNGQDVLLIDYRGYGKSTGPLYEDGLFYDAEAAYLYLTGFFKEDSITIYGQSMGSGIATRLASNYKPRQVILETPYTSMLAVAQGQYPWLPVKYLLDFPIQSKEHLAKLTCPILIFHGTADETIPYAMGKEMAEANPRAKLVTIQGAQHNECDRSAAYHEALNEAFQR